jgi:hypothetical protein
MADAHLSREELTAWRDEGTGDRDRLVSHLAACAACREAAAEVERDRPADVHPQRFDPADFVASGYRAGQPAAPRMAHRWIWVAATAALLALAVIPLTRPGRDDDQSSAMRGDTQAIVPIRPVDQTVAAGELTFEWKGTGDGERVRLTVVDLGRPSEPLIDREVAGTRYEPLPEERARLQPGQSLHWYVEVRGGGATRTSPAARFRVR